MVLLACASSAFSTYSRTARRFTGLEILVYGYTMALVLCTPILIWTEPLSWPAIRAYTGTTWLSVLVLSAFSWGLAMVLWMFVLRRIDVTQASVSIYLLPFLGVLISALTLHEHITGAMLIGGAITLAGAVMITVAESPSAEENVSMKLDAKVALITGAAQGIGAAIASEFAKEGAVVYAVDRGTHVDEPCAKIRGSGGKAFGRQLDITNHKAYAELVSNIVEAQGRIDILVNNAAIVHY
jgi:hypothetical protein